MSQYTDEEILEHLKGMELCAPRLENRFKKLKEMLGFGSDNKKWIIKNPTSLVKIRNTLPLSIRNYTIICWTDLLSFIDFIRYYDIKNQYSFVSFFHDRVEIQIENLVYTIEFDYIKERIEDEKETQKFAEYIQMSQSEFYLEHYVKDYIYKYAKKIKNFTFQLEFGEIFKFIEDTDYLFFIKQILVDKFLSKNKKYFTLVEVMVIIKEEIKNFKHEI